MSLTLIKNGLIVDGSGELPYKANLVIKDNKIEKISREEITGNFDLVIDASGKAVTPGFIDIHRHCDAKPLNSKDFADCMLLQGITSTCSRQLRHFYDSCT